MTNTVPHIPPPFRVNISIPSSPIRAGNTTDTINNTTTINVVQNVVDENLPQLLDSRGGSHVTNAPEFDEEDFSSWKDRFLIFLDGLEPYLLEILENAPFVPLSPLSNSEFLADLNAEFHEKALLANQRRFYKRSGRVGPSKKPLDKTNETCFACRKLGHYQKECPLIKTSTPQYPSSSRLYNKPKFHTNPTPHINQNVNHNPKDYRVKYKGLKAEITVLTKKIDAMNKGKRVTTFKALMVVADEPSVGKADARAVGRKGIRKEQNFLKEVVFIKFGVLTSETNPKIPFDFESEGNTQRPLPTLPKPPGVEPSCKRSISLPKTTQTADKAKKSPHRGMFKKPKCSTYGSADHLTKENLKQTIVKSTLVKHNAQGSSRKAPMSPKPYIPCKYCGFNDHHSDEYEFYPGCDLYGSIAHKTTNFCEKGKHHKASFKTKRSFSINKCLHLLHMDLFGPVKPQSISHNKYTLVIVDEYSRYTWVFCLKRKSDSTDCIISFIKKVENLNEVKGEAVNTACYTQNRSIIVKRHRKTAYDVFRGRSPDISYFHVFGCPMHIHNHKDHLGKFDEKADDGFFLGYSPVAKADETISQSSIEADAINFNAIRFFPDDEFQELRRKPNKESGNNKHLTYDSVSPEDHAETLETNNDQVLNKPNHHESAENLEHAEVQTSVLNEQTSEALPTPSTLSQTTNPFVPQDRWSKDKHIELVNIIGKVLQEDVRYLEESWYVRVLRSKALWQCHQLKLDMLLTLDDVLKTSRSRVSWLTMTFYMTREHILKGDIELYCAPTDLQLADIFTKPLAEPSFTRLIAELESSTQQQPQPLKAAANVHFECEDAKIAFNNSVTLLTSKISSHNGMLQFLSHCYNTLTFSLSHHNTPLTFDCDVFASVAGLNYTNDFILLPSHEVVKDAIATLGLRDEKNPEATSADLAHSSPLRIRYFTSIWRLMMIHIQADASVVPTDATKQSVEASMSAEEQDNQPQTADTEKIKENIVTEDEHNVDEHHDDAEFIDSGIQSMGDIPLDSLNKTVAESPYDTESEIQFVKRYKPVSNDKETLFTATSMDESNHEEDSDFALILDDEMESNITKKISKEIHSSVPTLINEALKQLPKLLIDALKSTLPTLVKDLIKESVDTSVEDKLPAFKEQVQQTFTAQIPDLFIKPMNKKLNALNKLESSRFVLLQKELSKVIRANIRKKVKAKVQTCLSKAAEVFKKANAEGEKWEKNNPESPKDMTERINKEAQAQKLAQYEAKRAKMLVEYNHYLIFRSDLRPITKINYKIDKVSKDATMRFERSNQPLSLTVMERFGLKQLGFTEWIEIQALASKGKSKAIDTLLRSLKAKFE
nr:hypothetical protein [Tanacetum cinerariifolium]